MNEPFQKEPKLSRARQIPEWDEYDREIARFAQKLAETGAIRSRMAAADANVLAGGGNNVKAEAVGSEEPDTASDVLGPERDEL